MRLFVFLILFLTVCVAELNERDVLYLSKVRFGTSILDGYSLLQSNFIRFALEFGPVEIQMMLRNLFHIDRSDNLVPSNDAALLSPSIWNAIAVRLVNGHPISDLHFSSLQPVINEIDQLSKRRKSKFRQILNRIRAADVFLKSQSSANKFVNMNFIVEAIMAFICLTADMDSLFLLDDFKNSSTDLTLRNRFDSSCLVSNAVSPFDIETIFVCMFLAPTKFPPLMMYQRIEIDEIMMYDCVEYAVVNLLWLLSYETETGRCDVDSLHPKDYVIQQSEANRQLIKFFSEYNSPTLMQSIPAHIKFIEIVRDYCNDKVVFVDQVRRLEIETGRDNYYKVIHCLTGLDGPDEFIKYWHRRGKLTQEHEQWNSFDHSAIYGSEIFNFNGEAVIEVEHTLLHSSIIGKRGFDRHSTVPFLIHNSDQQLPVVWLAMYTKQILITSRNYSVHLDASIDHRDVQIVEDDNNQITIQISPVDVWQWRGVKSPREDYHNIIRDFSMQKKLSSFDLQFLERYLLSYVDSSLEFNDLQNIVYKSFQGMNESWFQISDILGRVGTV